MIRLGAISSHTLPHPQTCPVHACAQHSSTPAVRIEEKRVRHLSHRGRSHLYTVAVHTIHTTSALTRSPHTEGSASSRSPHGATRGQEGDARVGPPPHPSQHTGYERGTAPVPAVSVLLALSTLSAAAPVEGGRVGNQWAAAAHPPSDPRGPDHPTGGR